MIRFFNAAKNFYTNRKVIVNIILSYILVSTILITLLSFSLTKYITTLFIEKTVDGYTETIDQMSNSADFIFSDIYESCYYEFKSNTIIKKAIYKEVFSPDDLIDIQNFLYDTLNINTLIDSVYIINPTANLVFSSSMNLTSIENFSDLDALNIAKNNHDFFVSRNVVIHMYNKVYEKKYITMTYSLTDYTGNFTGAMIVNLSQDSLQSIFSNENLSDTETNILDANGIVLSSNDEKKINTSMAETELYSQITSRLSSDNYLITNYNGQKSLVVFKKAAGFNMIFLSITPYTSIVNTTEGMRNFIIVLSMSFVIIGWILSIYFIRKIYMPISNLIADVKKKIRKTEASQMNEYQYLTHVYNDLIENVVDLNSDVYAFAQSSQKIYLNKLLNNEYLSVKELDENLRKCDVNFDESFFLVVVIKIDDFSVVSKQSDPKDIYLIRYAIANISTELLGESFYCKNIESNTDSVILIINSSFIDENRMMKIKNALTQTSENMKAHFSIRVSAGIGNIETDLDKVSLSYQNALTAVEYRIIFGAQSVIGYGSIIKQEYTAIDYPIEMEMRIANALRSSNIEDVTKNLDAFIDTIIHSNVESINIHIMQLCINLNKIFRIMEEKIGVIKFDHKIFINSLLTMDTLAQKKEYILQICDYYISSKDETEKIEKQEIILKVKKYIDEHYMNPDLVIEDLSQIAGYSNNYVRKLFKTYYNYSPTDYLTFCRFETAKKLLIETNLTAKEISEQVGISNTQYFYNAFKKQTGLTTFGFREKYRKNAKILS